MDKARIRQRVARSSLAPLAALPMRLSLVGKHDAQVARASARWLLHSREHTNLTYDLTPLNREHLAWFVAEVTAKPVSAIRGYIDEVEQDEELRSVVLKGTASSNRRRLADDRVSLAKRLGWYALVRAMQPGHVVETGTDKGLGTLVLAAALLRNGSGTVTTIDRNEDSGYLIVGRYAGVTNRILGDSTECLKTMTQPVDFFIHDSLHTREHEVAELLAVAPRLSQAALVVSDNAHVTDALPEWAEQNDWRYLFWAEQPADHWYPGAGIGAAWGRSGAR